VKKKLGEGGKKKVYLVHDKKLDRDVAFALIKTENLDEDGRKRVTREAQAMGKLGDNPHIVSIFEMGELKGQPYITQPVMGGGDVEALIEKAPDHKLSLDQTISIAKAVCQGLTFAHSKGIIHRDLKPGNVWLTDDGTAKIGDFGLAVMTDVSRLTMEGMMVGTVSYMPPEQAMQVEVTSKADLYSLGAMLYEMVTGRPPFVGDDSVSIIGQHLNMQPISPTWHRADLPPAFESLIMLLLEKDPEKRPASAKDVLSALESIEKGDIREQTVETQAPTENPIYRRIFVGRENELKTLQNTFIGAMSGQGALNMVVGEPGIGKTALCEQLSTFVTLRGGKTLWGHCYEEGSLSLPYLAFIEAMRSYVLDREPDDLKKELGSGATDVARIVSEIREKLHVEPRESQNPEEDRYRLMQAVASFLTNAAAIKPMLVILEDLHDADKGTLEMLSYVSRNLSGTRLLIIGTYRDVEVDRNHPLSAALAELRRVSSFGRVLLRGLNIDEVQRMLESLTQEIIPLGLAQAVYRQTEGNPLFVQEVVRYLTEEKLLTRESGKLSASDNTALEMSIPEGLRDVIGKRLSNLSAGCNELLSVASVIGREFALETLKSVSGVDETVFVKALKEAIQLSILEERSQVGVIRYRFTHAFFRQTLYEELIAPERLKWHQQIARSMEELYANRLEEHAVELAEHFSQSTDAADLKKAVQYGEMAAKRAVTVYAYGEAVRLLDETIRVQRVLDPDNKTKQCDLLLDLCDVLLEVPDTKRTLESEAPSAFSIAEATGNNSQAARACMIALSAIGIERSAAGYYTPLAAEWAEKANKYVKENTPEYAMNLCFQGMVASSQGNWKLGRELVTQAYNLSRELENSTSLWFTGGILLLIRATPENTDENIQIANELSNYSRTGVKNWILFVGLSQINHTFLRMGNRPRSEKTIDELRSLTTQTGNIYLELCMIMYDAFSALLDGRLDDAVNISRNLRTRGREAGVSEGANVLASTSDFLSRIYLGISLERLETAYRAFPISAGNGPTETTRLFCILLAHLGRNEEVTEYLDRFVVNRIDIDGNDDGTTEYHLTHFLEAAVIVGHQRAAEILSKRLSESKAVTTGTQQTMCIPRTLGAAYVLLGKYDEAREQYNKAVMVCTEMLFRPELALSRLGLAELLLDHYPDEKKEALEHLDFAIKEFREMKMQPSLERALRRKDILKA
jgi:tetratricopeptide (TPR) repeat protein